jgi:hypothetical protein
MAPYNYIEPNFVFLSEANVMRKNHESKETTFWALNEISWIVIANNPKEPITK